MSSHYKSPLAGYENAEPLPTTLNADGKSFFNPPGPRSAAYDDFPAPIDSSNNGFDFHIYYHPNSPVEVKYAAELHERIRREFPEFRVYKLWDKAVGPHPVPMFEVNVFTPHQTGTFFSWLVVNRGPLSVLVHPNTDDAHKDHTELPTWMGQPYPLYSGMLKHEGR
ncbi:DOPA-like domain-containing protein [Lenzites betulinus]|nr:DOPA-like domain-containing protein [Lenzites betulinus]